ncbi:hypothetical protein CKA32_003461 [Geitlerinema sp. FC II]|nr:hypothetical protein CKA32_006164 [Geitlerinema sp. FC II]PPT04938.1 hypothetical protein CKA32_003448 [Geitlerinema sp. FC II]PPT05005.1 hypothetical protein CKA32_003444 [Geitlerinema sp. FC II]PPT05479.1 hypothetical protein CKA32_004982 [Geitlerinema sp. FC II]PPT07285.1 hypothetical protein CKA32_003530 [Geitlerinema sp. FC II]
MVRNTRKTRGGGKPQNRQSVLPREFNSRSPSAVGRIVDVKQTACGGVLTGDIWACLNI